jgi:tetratricopeptide (TPR) repeat protein
MKMSRLPIIIALAFTASFSVHEAKADTDELSEVILEPVGLAEQSELKATLYGLRKEIEGSSEEPDSDAVKYFEAAENDFRSGRFSEAAKNFQKSIDVNPTLSAYLNLGNSFFESGNLKSAESAFLSGIRMTEGKEGREAQLFEGAFRGNAGLVYQSKGELHDALDYYVEALRIHREAGYRLGEAGI